MVQRLLDSKKTQPERIGKPASTTGPIEQAKRLPTIQEEVAQCGVVQKRRLPIAYAGGLVKAPHGPPHRDTGVIGIQRGSYVLPAETVRALGGAEALDAFVLRTTGRRPTVHQAIPAPRAILAFLPGYDDGGGFDIGADIGSDVQEISLDPAQFPQPGVRIAIYGGAHRLPAWGNR